MGMVTIEVDTEIFGFLQSQATPFVDSPNDVLRRLLLKKGLKIDGKQPEVKISGWTQSLPVFPGGVPKALEHTLQVAFLVRYGKMSRIRATQRIADMHGVATQTILDKYCRQLDLTAHQFDRLLDDKELKSLKELLNRKFPDQCKIINEYLSPPKEN